MRWHVHWAARASKHINNASPRHREPRPRGRMPPAVKLVLLDGASMAQVQQLTPKLTPNYDGSCFMHKRASYVRSHACGRRPRSQRAGGKQDAPEATTLESRLAATIRSMHSGSSPKQCLPTRELTIGIANACMRCSSAPVRSRQVPPAFQCLVAI
jgi:hypothetical protein